MDISAIGVALSTVKNALEISKAISASDASLEKAELKLKIAELVGTLADLKLQLVEVEEDQREQDKEIERLQDALTKKGTVVKSHDFYFDADADGSPVGEPYCLTCWERDARLFHLVWSVAGPGYVRKCTVCSNTFRN